MNETPIDKAENGSDAQIQMRVVAARRQIEAAFLRFAEGWPVQLAIKWASVDAGSKRQPPRQETAPYVRRLPVPEGRGRRIRYLKVEEIRWIEAERQYLRLHSEHRTFLVRGPSMTIENLATRLDRERFVRVHRSHIINLEQVEALLVITSSKRFVVLSSGQNVPVSQTYWEPLRASLGGGDLE